MRLAVCLLALASTASALTIDPAGYTGRYVLTGPGFPPTSFVGPQILPLGDGSYSIDNGANVCCTLGASSSFWFNVAAGAIVAVVNQATSQASGAATASGDTLTFHPVAIDFDPGLYTGRYFVTSYDGMALQGPQTLQLLADLAYALDDGAFVTAGGVASDFLFALDAAGDLRTTSAAAVASGNTLGFNSVTLSIDPGSYAGSWASSADPNAAFTGKQLVTFISGLTAHLSLGADGENFVPGAATLGFGGGETLSLSLASQAAFTPGGSQMQVPLSSVSLHFSSVIAPGTTSLVESGAGPPPPSGFKSGAPAGYFDLSTTAGLSGAIRVCVDYSTVSFGNPANLKLFHRQGGAWADVTTSHDLANQLLCGRVPSLSQLALFEATATQVSIDVQADVINLRSRAEVSVVVFGTPSFDVKTILPMSLLLASAPLTLLANGRLSYSTRDVDGDGRPDLLAHFSARSMKLPASTTRVTLTGKTLDGVAFQGSDAVRVIGRRR